MGVLGEEGTVAGLNYYCSDREKNESFKPDTQGTAEWGHYGGSALW